MCDPTAIELQITHLIQDRADYFAKRNYNTLTLPDFINKMKNKYEYLHTGSKTLFDKVMSGELDNPEARARLQQMLALMRTIHEGKRTQKDADMIFGKVMADKYVTPIINNLPTPKEEKENNGQ
jgi:hypothetical protein